MSPFSPNSKVKLRLTLSSLSLYYRPAFPTLIASSLPFFFHCIAPLQANAFLKLFIVAATGSQTYTGLYPDNKQVDTPLFCLYATMILLCSIPLTLISLFVGFFVLPVFIFFYFFLITVIILFAYGTSLFCLRVGLCSLSAFIQLHKKLS